jgi:hypothetical protein
MKSMQCASDKRQGFASRLLVALTAARQPTGATAFARAFNKCMGANSITLYGARKWLLGEALPTDEKLIVLAEWLRVDPSWLRFGDIEDRLVGAPALKTVLSVEMGTLVRDIESLSAVSQVIIRGIVDAFLRAASGKRSN